MSLTPDQRRLKRIAGQIGAHVQWSREADPTARTATARRAFMTRFEREARQLHPDGSEETIARAAEHLRKAHFARLALASAKARGRQGDAA